MHHPPVTSDVPMLVPPRFMIFKVRKTRGVGGGKITLYMFFRAIYIPNVYNVQAAGAVVPAGGVVAGGVAATPVAGEPAPAGPEGA
jgi:hypothetical protein